MDCYLFNINLLISTESEVILLYARKAIVTGISLNPSITKDQIIPVRQLKTAVGVDVSVEDQYLFWSDITADSISRVFLNGSGRETVVADGKPFSSVNK